MTNLKPKNHVTALREAIRYIAERHDLLAADSAVNFQAVVKAVQTKLSDSEAQIKTYKHLGKPIPLNPAQILLDIKDLFSQCKTMEELDAGLELAREEWQKRTCSIKC